MSRKILHFLVLAALVAVTSVAMADPPARVGRVTVTEGRVTMLVNGEEEAGNLMSWPVTTDNHLTTAPTARVEGSGHMLNVRAGKRVEERGDEIYSALATRDGFDDWAANRDRRDERPVAARYVPLDMTGYEDLDQYGNWVDDREYGNVWF